MPKGQLCILGITLSVVALCGCSGTDCTADIEAQHKALVQRIHREVSAGNLAIFDEILAPGYVRHCQAMPPGLQELQGTEQFKAFVGDFVRAVPDCMDEVQFIIAESDMVAYATTTTGTQTGPMGDLPASGKSFTLTNIVIHRFENGQIAETWISWDNVAMLTQLGHFPPPAAASSQAGGSAAANEYYRLFSGDNGESHFETRKFDYRSVEFAPPAPPLNLAELGEAESCFLLRGSPGWSGDWHPAPFRQLHFYLAGTVEVETSDGRTARVGRGDVALVEDTTGQGHRSRVIGSEDVVIAAVKLPAE